MKPDDVREMKTYVDANRTLDTPFDIVVETHILDLPRAQRQEAVQVWAEAGVTWCIEGIGNRSAEEVEQRIKEGPPVT